MGHIQKEVARRWASLCECALNGVLLRENDKASEWLEKAFKERADSLVLLKANPQMDTLRDDPRFDDLLRRIGLEP